MYSQRAILLLMLLLPAMPASARMELALIPKVGYMTPADSEQELNSVEFEFDGTPAVGLALDIRHMFGNGETPCGLAIGPEYLHYSYDTAYVFLGQPRTGKAESHAVFVAPKLMCVRGNTRYSLGVGFGFVDNYVDIGDRQIRNEHNFYDQISAAAEFGGKTLRVFTELRFVGNSEGDNSPRQYDGSGFAAFVGVSVILRDLPKPWKPWKPE